MIFLFVSMRVYLWFVVFCVEVFIIVCGNFIIILVFVLSKFLRKSKFMLFINFFVVDMLVGVFFLFLFLVYLGDEMFFWNIYWGLVLEIILYGLDVFFGFVFLIIFIVIFFECVYVVLVLVGYCGFSLWNYLFFIVLIWFVVLIIIVVCFVSNFVFNFMKIVIYVLCFCWVCIVLW